MIRIALEQHQVAGGHPAQIMDIICRRLHRIVFHVDLIAHLVVAQDILPHGEAGLQVHILHDGVGTHDGRLDEVVAQGGAELGALVAFQGLLQLLHTLPDGVTTVICGFQTAFGVDGDLDIHQVSLMIIDLIFHLQRVDLFVLLHLGQLLITDHDEDVKPVDQGIDEPVFVGLQALFLMDVQDLGRCDGALLLIHALDQVRVLGEMLDGLHRNFLR